MGMFDGWFGGSQKDDDAEKSGGGMDWELDHYEVKVHRSGQNSGWQQLEDLGEFSYPFSEKEFLANKPIDTLEPGTYRLWAIDQKGLQHPPREEEDQWSRKVEGETKKDDGTDRLQRELSQLRRELREEKEAEAEAAANQAVQDPQQLLESARVQLALQALQSEQFVKHHGERIALSAFDTGPDRDEGDMDYEKWRDDPIGASIWQMMEEPEKAENMGRVFGNVGSQFAQGFMANLDGDDVADVMTPEEEEAAEEEKQQRRENLDTGASSLDELGGSVVDDDQTAQMADAIAQARVTAERQAEAAQQAAAAEESPPPTEEEPDEEPEMKHAPANGHDDVEDFEETDFSEEEPTEEAEDDLPTPETPSELRSLSWNEKQKLASENGLKVDKYNQKSLTNELERQLFGSAPDEPQEPEPTPDPEPSGEPDEDGNPAPEEIAEGL